MKRSALDQLARDHDLSRPAIALALDLTGARPGGTAWNLFAVRLMHAAGIASLGAGLIFFVAANWQDYGLMGRFAILEAALAVCVGLALWKPPPAVLGQATLVLATLLTGTLLALFGQSYQTGADVYELFFVWAALALPFALAGSSGAIWATWWIVLDIGLALYCGWLGEEQFSLLWFARWGVDRGLALLIPAVVNLAGAFAFVHIGTTRFAGHGPRWLVRMLGTIGFIFGTAACIASLSKNVWSGAGPGAGLGGQDLVVVTVFAVICVLIAVAAIKARIDVFPMALIAASWIAISTAFIITHMKFADLGIFFLVPLWLIGTSTAAGFMLMRWVREWRVSEEAS